MARSGLKHGVPRKLSEGHVKLSLLSRELSIDRPISLRALTSASLFPAFILAQAIRPMPDRWPSKGGHPLPQARSTSLVLLQKQADPASSFLPQ
jgi:hypothetical protein